MSLQERSFRRELLFTVLVCHCGSRHEVRVTRLHGYLLADAISSRSQASQEFCRGWERGAWNGLLGTQLSQSKKQGAKLVCKIWCRRGTQDHTTIGRAPSWWDVVVVLTLMSRWKQCACCMELKLWEGPELVSFNLKTPLASSLWRRHGQHWVPRGRGKSPLSQGDPRARGNSIESSILEYPPTIDRIALALIYRQGGEAEFDHVLGDRRKLLRFKTCLKSRDGAAAASRLALAVAFRMPNVACDTFVACEDTRI